MRHLKGESCSKNYLSDTKFLRTCRMGRNAFKKVMNQIMDHSNFNSNPKKSKKERKEYLQPHSLHFLNFIGTFGNSSSNQNSYAKHEKGHAPAKIITIT